MQTDPDHLLVDFAQRLANHESAESTRAKLPNADSEVTYLPAITAD
jgi:hypothetical protein